MDVWTVRLTAACMLTLAGAGSGRALAASRRLRAVQLSDLQAALLRLDVSALTRLLPLRAALLEAGHPALSAVARALSAGDAAGDAWRASKAALTARGGPLSCLETEDLALLEPFFDGLGASGLPAQRLRFDDVQAQLAPRVAQARERAAQQAKLYGALGLLSGLCLAILLL